jgi:predicted glycosyltransferase
MTSTNLKTSTIIVLCKSMRIWIDVLTPKQALFFNVIRGWLKERGHEVFSTTRSGYGGFEASSLVNYDIVPVGKHGLTPYEKLIESSRRIELLADIVVKKNFDLSISFSSPECARVSYGLGVPHIMFSDSPHAVHASRLAVPLSNLLFTPWLIPKKVWVKYGISERKIVQYKCIDAAFWIKNWAYKDVRSELNLSNKATIVIRMHEEHASYLLGKNKMNVLDVIKNVVKEYYDKANIVVLARYPDQISYLKQELDNKIILPNFVDGPSLLKYSDIFIGFGGTMTHEAALLSVPSISLFPGKATLVESFLIRKGLVIRPKNPKKVNKIIRHFLYNVESRSRFERKAKILWSIMEDPKEKIISKIELFKEKV